MRCRLPGNVARRPSPDERRSFCADDCPAAIESLSKSGELVGDRKRAFNAFFLAMAHGRLGHEDEARARFDRALAWSDLALPYNELCRFRAEAAALRGSECGPDSAPSPGPGDGINSAAL